jgi:hypothetical protein
VVDTAGRVIERWRPADERPEIIDQTLVWAPLTGHPPLAISVAELFADVPGLGA